MSLIHVFPLSKLLISVWTTFFFSTLVTFRWEQYKLYWKGVVHLCLCHATLIIVAFQHNNNDYIHVQQIVLMTHRPALIYRFLGSSQSRWIPVTLLSLPVLYHGAPVLLLIMLAIIETKGLSRSFELFALLSLGVQVALSVYVRQFYWRKIVKLLKQATKQVSKNYRLMCSLDRYFHFHAHIMLAKDMDGESP